MKMTFELMLETLRERGYISLQIPEYDIDTRTGVSMSIDNAKPEDVVDMPDDWFMYVNGELPVIGKQTGFLHLTRKGYEANKDRLKEALKHAIKIGYDRTDGKGWIVFEKHAEKHFADMHKAVGRKRMYFKKMLAELDKAEKLI